MRGRTATIIRILPKAKLAELAEQNMSAVEISEQTKCSRAYVCRLAKEYNVKLPRKRRNFGYNINREKIRKKQLEAEGWNVIKNGWPDFLKYKRINGRLIIRAEEVKHEDEIKLTTLGLKPEQKELFKILSKILPIDLIHIDPNGTIENKQVIYYKVSNIIDHEPTKRKPKPKSKRPKRLNQLKPKSQEDVLFYKRMGELIFESRHKKSD